MKRGRDYLKRDRRVSKMKTNSSLNPFLGQQVYQFVEQLRELCKPKSVFVFTNTQEDREYIRSKAIKCGEEKKLAKEMHTVHYDGYYDQARDLKNTIYMESNPELLKKQTQMLYSKMEGIMKEKEMIIKFSSLGPPNSPFSVYCIQITDSYYVAHSEMLLYHDAYDTLVKQEEEQNLFKFVHASGELDERMNSKNIDQRGVYIDLKNEIVYSLNTQYPGNSLGLKKMALRLAIQRGYNEGWLAEHMFLMKIQDSTTKTKSMIAGAYPSGCGKTSTVMLESAKIYGDDLLYLRKWNGEIRGVPVEKGVFGIIKDVSEQTDKQIWRTLHSEAEIIFSNVLTHQGRPYWLGMGIDIPGEGNNHYGVWKKGQKDEVGHEVLPAHKNARYTVALESLQNHDPNYTNPEGSKIDAIVFGGREPNTGMPIIESKNWDEGIILFGASLESETTASITGKEGVRRSDPMSIIDFLSISLGQYIKNYLSFPNDKTKAPKIFSANYFLTGKEGNYLNGKLDKTVWMYWINGRVNQQYKGIESPIGNFPKYSDLKELFHEKLRIDYTKEEYCEQFKLRVNSHIEKLNRVERKYEKEKDVPKELFEVLRRKRDEMMMLQKNYGEEICPEVLESLMS